MIITESEDKNMQELIKRIHENGIDYVLVGDYYVPELKMPEEDNRFFCTVNKINSSVKA